MRVLKFSIVISNIFQIILELLTYREDGIMFKILIISVIIISIFIYVFIVGASIDKTTERVEKELSSIKKK